MNLSKNLSPKFRIVFLSLTFILFCLGIYLAVKASTWSQNEIISEHDKHLSQLASTVDHNIGIVLNRSRMELSDLVNADEFKSAEQTLNDDNNYYQLFEHLKKSTVLLPDYANRIIVKKGNDIILSTMNDDSLNYSIIPEIGNDDIWHCIDKNSNKSYIALSCHSKTNDNIYYVLVDMELFFRRVVVDSIYEDYWIVLYNMESGLALQNDNSQPDYKIFLPDEMISRNDGYSKIYEHEMAGITGTSVYKYINDEGNEQTIRIYVIPSDKSENKVFTTSLAIYNEHVIASTRKITIYNFIAAILVVFSFTAFVSMLLKSRKKEQVLSKEIENLTKEKEIRDEILQQQEQIVHHQKLETIGTMTAGIAHEFNNLLSPIMGNSMLILEKSRTENEEIFDNALEIYTASEKARELIQNISKLSRKQSVSQMSPVSPGKLVENVLNMSNASIPNNISVNKIINTDCKILGDENQLGYMLLNLIINAVQAMKPNAGTLTVSVDLVDEDIQIAVADTGKGIPEENMKAIFDPFFTTKDAGKGTGLGLPISMRTATNHGGTILVENLPQGGAKFTFVVKAIKD